VQHEARLPRRSSYLDVGVLGVLDVLDPTPAPDVGAAGFAPALDDDCPLPLLNPVGFDPLLERVVPLPSLKPVGLDPLLDPVPALGVPPAVPAAGAFAGALPAVPYPEFG